ncbi:hypothetical protein ACTNEN_07195 [Oribacterium sp. HCP28S3_H8]|jgi:hypothetical protein|uniref:hypothetical protein n=1 Tax=Oribacterium sp. HCP28S3_H8 TaxID=3438945 RepID=UPI003F8A4C74
MKDWKGLLKKHRKVALLSLFAIIVFAGFSVTSALHVAERRAAQQSQTASDAAGSDSGKTAGASEAEKTSLTESQKKLIKAYDSKTRKLIETLCAGVWSASDGKYTVRFYDDHYVETVNGEETSHPFAISACEFGNNGSDTEVDTIAFETDAGTYIATYTLVKSADSASAGQASLLSGMFALPNTAYQRSDAVEKIAVEGLDGEAKGLLGDQDAFVDALSRWCSTHYPSAVKATWNKNVTIDYDKGLVVTAFTLSSDESDGSASLTGSATPVITVTYDQNDSTYKFSV